MANIKVYQYGNTIRFECTFFDFDGNKVNPPIVKIKVYDARYNVIFDGSGINKDAIGEFFYDYKTEEKEQRLYYEWYGEIDDKPTLKRGQFMTKFI